MDTNPDLTIPTRAEVLSALRQIRLRQAVRGRHAPLLDALHASSGAARYAQQRQPWCLHPFRQSINEYGHLGPFFISTHTSTPLSAPLEFETRNGRRRGDLSHHRSSQDCFQLAMRGLSASQQRPAPQPTLSSFEK